MVLLKSKMNKERMVLTSTTKKTEGEFLNSNKVEYSENSTKEEKKMSNSEMIDEKKSMNSVTVKKKELFNSVKDDDQVMEQNKESANPTMSTIQDTKLAAKKAKKSTDKQERNYCCEICGNVYRRKYYLLRHMLQHSGEQPYTCDRCAKQFRYQNHLKRHILIHTGDRPFTCETYGKQFTQNQHLKNHMAIHSEERQFLCDTCVHSYCRES